MNPGLGLKNHDDWLYGVEFIRFLKEYTVGFTKPYITTFLSENCGYTITGLMPLNPAAFAASSHYASGVLESVTSSLKLGTFHSIGAVVSR